MYLPYQDPEGPISIESNFNKFDYVFAASGPEGSNFNRVKFQ
jgi:hypothetical protein